MTKNLSFLSLYTTTSFFNSLKYNPICTKKSCEYSLHVYVFTEQIYDFSKTHISTIFCFFKKQKHWSSGAANVHSVFCQKTSLWEIWNYKEKNGWPYGILCLTEHCISSDRDQGLTTFYTQVFTYAFTKQLLRFFKTHKYSFLLFQKTGALFLGCCKCAFRILSKN
jgi:hypothetical protein